MAQTADMYTPAPHGEWVALPAWCGAAVLHPDTDRFTNALRQGGVAVLHGPERSGKSTVLRHACRLAGRDLFVVPHGEWCGMDRVAYLHTLRAKRAGVLALDNAALGSCFDGYCGEDLVTMLGPGWAACVLLRTAAPAAQVRAALPGALRRRLHAAQPEPRLRRSFALAAALAVAGRRYRWPPQPDGDVAEHPDLAGYPHLVELLQQAWEDDPCPRTLCKRAVQGGGWQLFSDT
jgi:hypothetical protein